MSSSRKKAQRATASKAQEPKPLIVRLAARQIIKTPPVILGYANLVKPDEGPYGNKFKANGHFTPAAMERFAERLQKDLFGALIDDLKEEARALKKSFKEKPMAAWLKDHMQEAKEGFRIQMPFMTFKANPSFKNKEGEDVPVTMKAWDAHGAPVDLKELRVGMGSIVQVAFTGGLFVGNSPLLGDWRGYAVPTMRLVGVQVLKLEQYGAGGNASLSEVTDEELALCEENFTPDDLSAYVNADGAKHVAKDEAAADGGDDTPEF